MGFLAKLRTTLGVMSKRSTQGTLPTVALQRQRPAILLGTSLFELGQLASGTLDPRLKNLAQVKTSALVGCPF